MAPQSSKRIPHSYGSPADRNTEGGLRPVCGNSYRGPGEKYPNLHRARTLHDLAVPPGNRLEALKRDRAGQHSIRINDQWRICFRWQEGDAYDVEIVDYH